jgi:hypothetical protein
MKNILLSLCLLACIGTATADVKKETTADIITNAVLQDLKGNAKAIKVVDDIKKNSMVSGDAVNTNELREIFTRVQLAFERSVYSALQNGCKADMFIHTPTPPTPLRTQPHSKPNYDALKDILHSRSLILNQIINVKGVAFTAIYSDENLNNLEGIELYNNIVKSGKINDGNGLFNTLKVKHNIDSGATYMIKCEGNDDAVIFAIDATQLRAEKLQEDAAGWHMFFASAKSNEQLFTRLSKRIAALRDVSRQVTKK